MASEETAGYERAVIWVNNSPEWAWWVKQCIDYCARKDYELTAVVTGRGRGRWKDVDKYLKEGRADLAVVANRDRLPRKCPWRIESVAENLAGLGDGSGRPPASVGD